MNTFLTICNYQHRMKSEILGEFYKKKILITGGTGSIGVGLIKNLIKYKPKEIRILSNDENSFFEIRREFNEYKMLKFIIGDIRDQRKLSLVIRDVDIIFHAAAMKHVDLCEENPFDAVQTNVIGTSNLIQESIIQNVEKFVLISTDKATNPSTTLGASKLLAERLTLNANSFDDRNKTVFLVVRFGNVVGSRGSVFQIFLRQLQQGKSLTVADKRMTRFIMSIPQATSLILRATVIGKNGEIFILKMPAVKITDFVESLISQYKKRISLKKEVKIEKYKAKERERYSEYLITQDEIEFCHDLGAMYKISKKESKQKLNQDELDSKTAKIISKIELDRIMNETLDDYLK